MTWRTRAWTWETALALWTLAPMWTTWLPHRWEDNRCVLLLALLANSGSVCGETVLLKQGGCGISEAWADRPAPFTCPPYPHACRR